MKAKLLIKRFGYRAISPVLLVLLILLSLALLIWHQSSQQQQFHSELVALQQQRFEVINVSLKNAIKRQHSQLSALVNSPQLDALLTNPQQNEFERWAQQVEQSLPEVEKLCVLLTLPTAPGTNDCLPISFATLASLRQLKEATFSDMAMMQPGSDSAHIVLAQRLNAGEKYPEASLIMVLKPSWLDEQIDDSYVAGGYLEVTQGQNNALTLTGFGQPHFKQLEPLFSQPVADSVWTLAYWSQPTASGSSWLVLSLLSLILLLFWLLRDGLQSRVMKADSESLQMQLHDLQLQKMKPTYVLINSDLQRVSEKIHDVVIPKKSEPVLQSRVAEVRPKTQVIEESSISEIEQTSPEAEVIVEKALEQASKKDADTQDLSEAHLSFDPPKAPTENTELEFDLPPSQGAKEGDATALPDEAIFRHYDIRGKVGPQLNVEVMQLLGQAVGSEALEQSQSRLVLGRDGRLTSNSLAEAFMRGVLSSGCGVIDIGQVPTPMAYFACEHLETHTGAMITGSHNPVDYNGLKVVIAGKTLLGEGVRRLYDRIRDKRLKKGHGQLMKENIHQAYIDRIKGDIKLSRKMNIVIDSGNGVAGNIAPDLFRALGCDVTELYCDVDGNFPNHHPDPGQPENMRDLSQIVTSQQAELGLAYDGDGDRLGVVDGDGNIIWPDRLLLLMAQHLLSEQPGATILYDVKSTSLLDEVISRAGGLPIMTPSGHSVIKHLMHEHGAMLAGEMTGHFFFRDRWYGFDDALYSAARLLELLAADPLERTPTEVFAALPSRISTPEIIVEMAEGESHRFIEQLQANVEFVGGKLSNVDGIRVDYPQGWGLVRASNTVPGLTLRFEANSKEELEHIKQQFIQQMLQIKPTLSLLF